MVLFPNGGFNPFSAGDEKWTVLGFKHRNPAMSFREIAYTLMDDDIAYFSPSTVYRILKKYDLITPWNRRTWASTRPEHEKSPDERWQTDIMHVKIKGRFFYLLVFIDEYSRYITHNALLTSMDADSVSLEAQAAIDRLRKDSIAEPLKQGIMDHHSSPWNSEWCLSRTISHRISYDHIHLDNSFRAIITNQTCITLPYHISTRNR